MGRFVKGDVVVVGVLTDAKVQDVVTKIVEIISA